jgi:hypothetical protein
MITALLTLNLRFGGGGTFEKGFYLLPCLALFCYVGTDLGTEVLKNKKTWIIAVLYAIIIQAGASMQYDIAAPRGLTSLHKVEYTTIWLADYISEHCSKEIYMFAPQEIACGIQEYEPDIRVAYGEGFDYDADDLAALLVRMDEYGCNCLVVPWEDQVNDDGSEKETAEYIMSTGYRKLVLYDGYTVYVRQTI